MLSVCELHEEISKRRDNHACEIGEKLTDHEERIRDLEKDTVRVFATVDGLCKRMDSLIGWFKAVFVIFLAEGVALVTWLIKAGAAGGLK